MRPSDERLVGGLVHLSIFLHGLGIFVALIIYIILRDRSYFAARHALQSMVYQLALYLLVLILGFLGMGTMLSSAFVFHVYDLFGPGFGLAALVGLILFILGVVIPVVACVKGLTGHHFRYPVTGRWTDRIL